MAVDCNSFITTHSGKRKIKVKSRRQFLKCRVEQIVGRERRGHLSQLVRRGGGCFDARRRVNSTVMCFYFAKG